MADPTPFTQLLTSPKPTTRKEHLDRARAYADVAEDQMADQLRRGSGSVNPPHALRFAELHVALAAALA
jgi:hypothetical protein